MLKKELRSSYGLLRKKISEETLSQSSLAIANALLQLPIWHHDYFHLFMPISAKREIDTSFVLTILQGKDKHVIVPKVEGNTLSHFLLTDATKFVESSWGVPEPLDGIALPPHRLDVVFVPLVAFDKFGNRVGYGKGFYDGFLKECRAEVIKIGLSFFESADPISDVAPHDIRLDYCVTPKKIYSFSKS
ncbi:5-formyltetrahydrofolate cyclo-ligase [Aggregatimonas sangjinii]|uniref:5-formyltetrahydrofolate cyclo-ligase n=1 Tax=Aggregatimonas sangjinii TaxID=2583587 RepID=A0A5B7SV96_9FLAO|nr:5-formyltetrahydrofolate cyclo-ligase [Aggregatimonas sangjinii]QCX02122.1 5-formyltetrahydrofolate cyclo-ligase [Aggregatimonas sangjinii]